MCVAIMGKLEAESLRMQRVTEKPLVTTQYLYWRFDGLKEYVLNPGLLHFFRYYRILTRNRVEEYPFGSAVAIILIAPIIFQFWVPAKQ